MKPPRFISALRKWWKTPSCQHVHDRLVEMDIRSIRCGDCGWSIDEPSSIRSRYRYSQSFVWKYWLAVHLALAAWCAYVMLRVIWRGNT